MNLSVPWFVRGKNVDKVLLQGDVLSLNITCTGCGAWGDYLTWSMGPTGQKVCPQCGEYTTRRVE